MLEGFFIILLSGSGLRLVGILHYDGIQQSSMGLEKVFSNLGELLCISLDIYIKSLPNVHFYFYYVNFFNFRLN